MQLPLDIVKSLMFVCLVIQHIFNLYEQGTVLGLL